MKTKNTASSVSRTFVGFGFGAIQAGLFLSQAQSSKKFDRLVVAYRRPEIIAAIRQNNGYFKLNIAYNNHIKKTKVGAVEIYDVNKNLDQEEIISAIAEASEISTALSSTKDYVQNTKASVHSLLAQGLIKKILEDETSCIIYTAENNNKAAQKLLEAIMTKIPSEYHNEIKNKVQILNTVIGKMSITIRNSDIIQKQELATITPNIQQAFLVEEFSHILIDKISLKDFSRGINSFVEKDNLHPFEEAKLYGHNAIHAMAAYLAVVKGIKYIKDLEPEVFWLLRKTFEQEIGKALIKKYNGTDELFSPNGFQNYAENLLERMQNPFLNDTAARVSRDIERKLGWNDRLIGSIRLCLSQDIKPSNLTLGVVAALQTVNQIGDYKNYLTNIWQLPNENKSKEILDLIGKVIKEEKIK